eukprot:UN31111
MVYFVTMIGTLANSMENYQLVIELFSNTSSCGLQHILCGFDDYDYDKTTGLFSKLQNQNENLDKICQSFLKLLYKVLERLKSISETEQKQISKLKQLEKADDEMVINEIVNRKAIILKINRCTTRLLIHIRGFICTHFDKIESLLLNEKGEQLDAKKHSLLDKPIPSPIKIPDERPKWAD